MDITSAKARRQALWEKLHQRQRRLDKVRDLAIKISREISIMRTEYEALDRVIFEEEVGITKVKGAGPREKKPECVLTVDQLASMLSDEQLEAMIRRLQAKNLAKAGEAEPSRPKE